MSISAQKHTVVIVGLGLALNACALQQPEPAGVAATSSALRSLSKDEALADFDQIVTEFRSLYGALTRKEQRYGFSFDDLASQYRAQLAQARSEAEDLGVMHQFLARFEDAHVSLVDGLDASDDSSFVLPFSVMPIEHTFVVYDVSAELADQIARGDELLGIDGVPAAKLSEQFAGYIGGSNPLFSKHAQANYFTNRPPFLAAGLRDGAPAEIALRDASGKARSVSVNWKEIPTPLPPVTTGPVSKVLRASAASSASVERAASAELAELGAPTPFFMRPEVEAAFHVEKNIVPSAAALAKFKVSRDVAAHQKYFAYRYTYCDARILLLRLPDYEPGQDQTAIDDTLNYLRALFYEQAPLSDGLVLDQTHNAGGDLYFAANVLSLLTANRIDGIVQQMHADREWIGTYIGLAQEIRQQSSDANPPDAVALEDDAHQIDLAYSTNQPLSAPLPFPGMDTTINPDPGRWPKPFIVLCDELSASAADTVPLIVKANHLGTLFGQRTVGAGGSVEQVATLPNTGFALNLSRGLTTVFDPSGTYPEQNYIEDQGVTPDISYSHTLADFRAGYVGYVRAFSDALLAAIRNDQ